MSELARDFIKYEARYFNDFFAMLCETKKFVETKSAIKTNSLKEPFFFLLCSIGLVVLAFGGLTTFTSVTLAKLAVLTAAPLLLLVILVIVLEQGIWGSLGGKGSARRSFRIFAYYYGVTAVLSPFVGYLIVEVFRLVMSASPGLYKNVWQAPFENKPIPTYDVVLAAIPMVVVLFVLGLTSTWVAPGRKAFNRMHGLSRRRSFVAQALYSVAWPLAFISVMLVYSRLLQIAAAN